MKKHVCRSDLWIDPAFDQRLAAETDITLEIGASPARRRRWPRCWRAHVYHVSLAWNELPPRWHVAEPLLKGCPNLLAVSSGGVGHDTVDVGACTRAGVAVVNQIGGNALSVADLAIGLMLAVSRKICVSDRLLRTGRGFPRESLMGREISDATLGIVGLGHTGTQVARLARGFGMRVLAADPLLPAAEIERRGAAPIDLPTLLADADVVSLHCPLDAGIWNVFDARAFAARSGARCSSPPRAAASTTKRRWPRRSLPAISRAPVWTSGSRNRRRSTRRC